MRSLRFFVAVLVLMSVVSAWAAARDLLAEGSGQNYWIARIDRDQAGHEQTTIQSRQTSGSDRNWKQIAQIGDRVVWLTTKQNNLVALLQGGDWMTVWDDGSSSGILPEDGSKILMLAGENDAIWAVTAARAGRSPTTAAATQPATTMPIGTLLLEQLKQGHWTMLALLPPSATAAKDFSFAILDGRPVLAILLDHDEVRTFSWNSDRAAWESTAQISTAASTTQIKLLRDLPHSALWSGGASGGGTIHFNDSSPIALAIAGDAAVQDLTVAAQSIRVLSLVNGKITEYAFAPDGAARGEVVLPQPTSPQEQMPFEWLSAVAAGLLVLALLNTMRRREAATPESLEKAGVELAPMMRRIVAGTIDALPMIAVVFYILMNTTDSTDVEAIFASRQILIYSSTAVYILHTLIAELIWGRSLGKWVCGLRVVTIDGTPPRRRAIVIRNLLRVIDVGMVFMLLVVLFSPLRQRVGDLAAETVVVKAVEPPKT